MEHSVLHACTLHHHISYCGEVQDIHYKGLNYLKIKTLFKARHPSLSNCTWPHIIEFCVMFVLSSARVHSLGL